MTTSSRTGPVGLNRETVEKVSKLARLRLNEDELNSFSQQLSAVLENFEQISQVDTTGVRPLVTPSEINLSLRPDVKDESIESEKFLENAAEKSGRLFKVPPVV